MTNLFKCKFEHTVTYTLLSKVSAIKWRRICI